MLKSLKMKVPIRLCTGNTIHLKCKYTSYARNYLESIRTKVHGLTRLQRILGQDTTLARSDKLLYLNNLFSFSQAMNEY